MYSRSSRLAVKSCFQTRMPCVGSSLFISFAGSRFPVACLLWSVSIGFPHACLSLRVVTGSGISPNFLLDVEDKMLLEYDDSLDTTRSSGLSVVEINVFPFWVNCGVSPFSTHMNIRVLSKSWWSNRIAGVLSSNCTVTNRSRSWTKTCAYSFICTAPVCGKSLMGCWTFSKFPLRISLHSVVHWSSRIHNKHTIFCVSGAFTRT